MEAKKPAQVDRLAQLLSDGRAHRTDEIMEKVYGDDHLGLARIGARIWDLKRRGRIIDSWRDKRDGKFTGLHWYMDMTEITAQAKAKVAEEERHAGETPALPLHAASKNWLW